MTPPDEHIDFTVAICTYNGASRLPNVLDRLMEQERVSDLSWEVVVVDNHSSDSTPEVVFGYQSDWPETSSLRYVYEPRPGKTNAVKRAFDVARGSRVGFLDDDNVPDSDWVAAACAFGMEHPQAGAYGGCIYPEYEATPPENIEGIEGVFAIVRYDEMFRYPKGGPFGRMFAPGAGLVIRKEAWHASVPEKLKLSGPLGSSSLGLHEDMEIQWHIHKNGWEIWHTPTMRITHRISSRRFETEYLMRFFKELALSRYKYRMLTYPWWQRPVVWLAYFGSDIAKLAQTHFEYHSEVDSRVALECRMQMQKYLLISPLYNGLFRWK